MAGRLGGHPRSQVRLACRVPTVGQAKRRAQRSIRPQRLSRGRPRGAARPALVEASAAPRRGRLAAAADALARPGALERRLADEALAHLFLAGPVQLIVLVEAGRVLW